MIDLIIEKEYQSEEGFSAYLQRKKKITEVKKNFSSISFQIDQLVFKFLVRTILLHFGQF